MLNLIPPEVWAGLAVLGAALAGLAGAYFKGRGDGKVGERTVAMQRAAEQRTTRDEIDRAVAREPDPSAELQRDWKRPGL